MTNSSNRKTRQARSASRARAERITTSNPRTVRTVNVHRRLLSLLALFLLAGVAYVGVLVDLQALRPEEYVAVGEKQRTRTIDLAGYRGTITDRDGFVLALSTPGTEVVVDPTMLANPAATADLLGPVLGQTATELLEKLVPDNKESRYALVAPAVTQSQAARLALLRENSDNADALVGVFVQAQEERVYPAGSLATPVIGRVNRQELGTFGLEWQFDELMQGSAGYEQTESGAFGSITGGEYVFEAAVPGNDIVLTLDHRIQYVTEQELIDHCEETEAAGANAVVSDTRTGEILAMATVIRKDGVCQVPRSNAPLQATFEPGSVIKMVTAAAVVEDQGVGANTVLEVPERIEVGDKWFSNHSPAAPYPIRQIIGDSMNAGTIQLAQQVGPDRLRYFLEAFGFGQPTGLDFRYEANGKVPAEWYGSDIGSIAIGQGISVNTVQLAAAYNVIANGGHYIAPSLIRSMVGPDGTHLPATQQDARRVVSAETAAEVTTMLVDVVSDGTGTEAAVPGYTVAGKTGTAWQVYEQPDGSFSYGPDGDRRYVVTFAGFLPAEDPQLSIVVVVNAPNTGASTSAGKIAAPVFSNIAEYAIRILGIPPGNTTHQDLALDELVRGTPAPATGESAVESEGQVATVPQGTLDEAEPVESVEPAEPDVDQTEDLQSALAGDEPR